MIIPNMVNKTSTVLMTFFMGCNPVDRKFERHGRPLIRWWWGEQRDSESDWFTI